MLLSGQNEKRSTVWIRDGKNSAVIFAGSLFKTFFLFSSHTAVPMGNSTNNLQSIIPFWTQFFIPLPSRGRCVSRKARGMLGCHETVARQPRVYTPQAGRGRVNMASQGTSPSPLSDASPTSTSPQELLSTPPLTSTAISESPRESKASSPSPLLQPASPEDSLPTAAFYGPLDAKNPLLASFEKEIRELLGFMKKKKALATTTAEEKHEFRRRW